MDRQSWKILRDYALSEPEPYEPPTSPFSTSKSPAFDHLKSSFGNYFGEVGARNKSQMQPYYQQGQGGNPFSSLGSKTLEMLGIVKDFIDPGNFEGTRTSGANFAANPTPTNALNAALNPIQDVAMIAAMGPGKAAAKFMEQGVAPAIKKLSPLMALSAMEPGEAEAAVGPTKWYSMLKRAIQGAPIDEAPADQWLTKKVIPAEEIYPHSLLSPKQGGGFRFRTEVPGRSIPERTEFGGYLGSQKGLSQEQLDELHRILSGELDSQPLPSIGKDFILSRGFRDVDGQPIDPDKMLSEAFHVPESVYNDATDPFHASVRMEDFVEPNQYDSDSYRTKGPVLDYQETVATSPMAGLFEPDAVRHFHNVGEDQIYHTRTSQRQGPEGTHRILEEVQSDRHQRGRKEGYYREEDKRLFDTYDQLVADNINERRSISSQVDHRGLTDEEMARLRELDDEYDILVNTQPDYGTYKPAESQVPDAPFKKDWVNLGVRRALWEAASAGDSALLMTPKGEQTRRWANNPGLQEFYDTQVSKALRQEAKRLGLPEDAVTEMPVGKAERFTDTLLGSNNRTTTLMARQNLGELADIESEDQLDEFIFDNLGDLTDSFTTLANRFTNNRNQLASEVGHVLFDTRDISTLPEEALREVDLFTKAATDTARHNQKVGQLQRRLDSMSSPELRAPIADELDRLEEEFMDSGHVLDAATSLWKLSRMPEANKQGPKALGFKLTPEMRQKILDEGMPFKRGGLAQVRHYMAGGSVNFGPLTTPYG